MSEIRSIQAGLLPELDTEEKIASYLGTVLAQGHSGKFVEALKAVSWARTISIVATRMGLPRADIAPMLQGEAPLTLDVMARVLAELRVKLTVSATPAISDGRPDPAEPAYVRRF